MAFRSSHGKRIKMTKYFKKRATIFILGKIYSLGRFSSLTNFLTTRSIGGRGTYWMLRKAASRPVMACTSWALGSFLAFLSMIRS